MLERRVHYIRHNHYKTKSNAVRVVKTPGKHIHSFIQAYAFLLFRWKTHCSILEEKSRKEPSRYPQDESTSTLKTHSYQENRLQTIWWKINWN